MSSIGLAVDVVLVLVLVLMLSVNILVVNLGPRVGVDVYILTPSRWTNSSIAFSIWVRVRMIPAGM